MAANELVYSFQEVESTVNRFTLDYYMSLALELFKSEQYDDFCGVRDVIEGVLGRPKEKTDVMQTKIRVLQFLSRINEGEQLDVTFESDESITPLESALMLLDGMNEEFSLPQPGFENVCAAVKEMMVRIFIKNYEFDKAKKMLNKHFSKGMAGKKSIFMSLIRRKSNKHEVIEQIDFQRFKEEMLAFCLSLFPYHVPYLHKAATRLINERLKEQDDKAAGPEEEDGGEQAAGPEEEDEGEQAAGPEEEDEGEQAAGPDEVKEEEAGPSSSPQTTTVRFLPGKHRIIQRTRLEVVYIALAAGSDEKTFAQLEEEVEGDEQRRQQEIPPRVSPTPTKGTTRDSEQDGLFQRDSGSPMEASPADQPTQTDAVPETQAGSLSKTPPVLRNRQPYTLAHLVVQPDSQASSQCSNASQEPEADVRAEEPPQSPTTPSKEDSQSLLTDNEIPKPTWKTRQVNRISSRASTSLAELSADSEDDPPGSVANSHNQSNTSLSRTPAKSKQLPSTSEEEPQESPAPFKTPVQKPCKEAASDPLTKDPDAICINDSSLDSSPNLSPPHPVPQTSSTPVKHSAKSKGLSHAKWKELYDNAKESKETWTDEESCFGSGKRHKSHNESTMSVSGRKRKWSESETKKLKEGVKKFGEGNWSKIKAYYSFDERTNVNLKDRWRTMKNLKLV